jgi:hypothetical protein
VVSIEDISTSDLRAELGRRDRLAELERRGQVRALLREQFGVCAASTWTLLGRYGEPDETEMCGRPFTGYSWREIRPILAAPPGRHWLLPPSEYDLDVRYVGSEREITLTCDAGHATILRNTVIFKEPL